MKDIVRLKHRLTMKNSELIKILKKYNPNADVTLTTSEDITLSYVCEDLEGNVLTEKNTPIVFIEGCDKCPQCIHEYMNIGTMWCSFYDKSCKDVDECFQFEEFDEQE